MGPLLRGERRRRRAESQPPLGDAASMGPLLRGERRHHTLSVAGGPYRLASMGPLLRGERRLGQGGASRRQRQQEASMGPLLRGERRHLDEVRTRGCVLDGLQWGRSFVGSGGLVDTEFRNCEVDRLQWGRSFVGSGGREVAGAHGEVGWASMGPLLRGERRVVQAERMARIQYETLASMGPLLRGERRCRVLSLPGRGRYGSVCEGLADWDRVVGSQLGFSCQ